MTHRRQSVRAAFVAAVNGLGLTGTRVYASRLYPLQADELPALRVYTPSETSDAEAMGLYAIPQQRRIRIVCECVAKAATGADDAADAICEQVEAALNASPTLGGAVQRLTYQGYEQEMSAEIDQPVFVARMTFEAIAAQ